MYGWRARIGLIYPSSGKRDLDFQRLAPAGVSTHVARVAFEGSGTLHEIGRMSQTERLVQAARLLADLPPDVVTWADTSGSFMFGRAGDRAQAEAIRDAAGAPASTTSTALLSAFARLGARRIAVASPYLAEVNDALVEFFAGHGVQVGLLRALELGHEREISRATPETVYRLARDAWFPGAQALLIPCTDFEAVDLIAPLERDLGTPVLTSNQATMWHALRLAGIQDGVPGFGRLMDLDLA
jgi:maleate cis-trans isomerase